MFITDILLCGALIAALLLHLALFVERRLDARWAAANRIEFRIAQATAEPLTMRKIDRNALPARISGLAGRVLARACSPSRASSSLAADASGYDDQVNVLAAA